MKKLAPVLAIALLCMGCDAPFDLSYSQAAALTSKMTLRQTLAPLNGIEGDQAELDLVFLPDKTAAVPGIDFQNGFLIMRGPYRTVLRYLRSDSATGSFQTFGWEGQDFVNPDPSYLPVLFEPLRFPTVAQSPVGIVRLDPLFPENSEVQILNADFASASLVPGMWTNIRTGFVFVAPAPVYDASVLGFNIYPTDGAQVFDTSYWLVRVGSGIDAGKLREISMDVAATGFTNKSDTKVGAVAFDVPELAAVTRCHYFHDPDPVRGTTPADRKSYVSWFDAASGGWKCVRWNGVGFADSTALPFVTHRIDALLTTGRLFSTEAGVGRVYDAGGVEIASFPLGALRFIGERYLDGVPLALFTLARTITEKDSQDRAIDVYSIPAAGLETLGD